MSFETRSVVAKECMLRVCEAAGLRPHTEYAELSEDPQIQEVVKMLDPEPDMTHSLTNVTMTVSVSSLKIDHSETGVVSTTVIVVENILSIELPLVMSSIKNTILLFF
jgi:hypothetical protein